MNSSISIKKKVFAQSQIKNVNTETAKKKIKLGQIFSLKIHALGPKKMGLVEFQNGLTILVPNAQLGDLVKVKLEKILNSRKSSHSQKQVILGSLVQVIQKGKGDLPKDLFIGKTINLTITRKGPKNSGLGFFSNDFPIIVPNIESDSLSENTDVIITKLKSTYAFAKVKPLNSAPATKKSMNGQYSQLVLPLNPLNFGNFFALKFNGNYLFVQKSLGIKGGDEVLVKIHHFPHFSVGKVIKVGSSQNQKVKYLTQKMIQNSMHYGERVIKCNANMRSYLWLRKKGKNSQKPLLKRGRHILNLFKTYKSLKKSLLQLSKYAATGHSFLLVGTKKSASSLIARTAVLSQTAFFVNNRWLGGMLTNWKTILKSLSQMKPILKEKQKVTQNLLFSRQKIKDRLLSKVNVLRKKSRVFLNKGKGVLKELQQNPHRFIEKNEFILKQKNIVLIQNKNYIEKYSVLSIKEQNLLILLNSLKSHFQSLLKQKTYLKNQILSTFQEMNEMKQLFLIGEKIAQFQNSVLASGKTLWSVPYSIINTFDGKSLPNPSGDILNQMISIYVKKSNFVFNGNESKSPMEPVILSKLLEKFSIYLPFMKKYLVLNYQRLNKLETSFQLINKNLELVKTQIETIQRKALDYKTGLEILKSKLFLQQKYLKAFKIKLMKYSSEQRLLKFLPKLRNLPTTKTKMYQRVELLMKKFVDPKMSYVIDQIYDQKFQYTSKKMAAARKQKWQRLEKYFGGVTQMAKMSLKHNNLVAVIIGQQEEMNAVRECKKLGIKMFTVVDTNCNPQFSDYIIPANDDSSTSIEYILGQMLTYIRLAQKLKRKI